MDKMIQISVNELRKQLDIGYSIVRENGDRAPFDMVYGVIQTMNIMGFFPSDIMDYANDVYDKVWGCIRDVEQGAMLQCNEDLCQDESEVFPFV